MQTAVKGKIPVTLEKGRLALVDEFGDSVPSLITLKRRSAAGLLDSAKIYVGKRLVGFDTRALRRLVMGIDEAVGKKGKPSPLPEPELVRGLVDIDYVKLADTLAAALVRQVPGLKSAAQLAVSARELDYVRHSLMEKYDAADGQKNSVIAGLRSELKESRDVLIDFVRMKAVLGRMEDQLQRILEKHDGSL